MPDQPEIPNPFEDLFPNSITDRSNELQRQQDEEKILKNEGRKILISCAPIIYRVLSQLQDAWLVKYKDIDVYTGDDLVGLRLHWDSIDENYSIPASDYRFKSLLTDQLGICVNIINPEPKEENHKNLRFVYKVSSFHPEEHWVDYPGGGMTHHYETIDRTENSTDLTEASLINAIKVLFKNDVSRQKQSAS